MILEIDRMLADWFNDPVNGVNALLPSTRRDNTDTQPANVALITDETRHGDAARGELPETKPVIVVSLDQIIDLDGQVCTITADGKCKVRIRIGLDNADSEEAVRDLSYYMRTATRSFRRFMALDANTAARTRNAIYLETCDGIQQAIVWTKDQAGSATATGYIIPTITLRDQAP